MLHSGWKTKLQAWLTASRLTFYIEPAIAFSVGALAASAQMNQRLWWTTYLLGYVGIVLVEFITVMTNELADFQTDRMNQNSGTLTGGSRVLVTQRLSPEELRRGRAIALGLLAVVLAGALMVLSSPWPVIWLALFGLALGIGYSAPPVRLSARGLGELAVAIAHSFFLLLAGWLSQEGLLSASTPYVLALPLGLAVLPSIILAGFPDYEADEATGKRTLAIRWGRYRAAILAGSCALLAVLAPICLAPFAPHWHWWCVIPAAPHAGWLCWELRRYLVSGCPPGRIDRLLSLSLTFMFWFCVVPLAALLVCR